MTTEPTVSSTPDKVLPNSLKHQPEGDTDAVSCVFVIHYADLLRRTRLRLSRENPKHLHDATAVLNESYTRMRKRSPRQTWQNSEHILRTTSTEIDRFLVEDGRARQTLKRGWRTIRVPVDEAAGRPGISPSTPEQTIALREILKRLEATDQRIYRVIYMRFFKELSREEIARRLGVSVSSVKTKLKLGLIWLRGHLEASPAKLVSKSDDPVAG